MRGERDAAARTRGPHVAAPLRDFLHVHVPAARDQPAGDEIDGGSFGAGGRLQRDQLGGESDDVGHAGKLPTRDFIRQARRVV
jgi:hypothetical protein